MSLFAWQPGIGDPSFFGWFTVAAYGLAAVYGWRVVKASQFCFDTMQEAQKKLWVAITAIVVLLGINKQLDLQTLLTEVARYVFLKMEIYEQRRHFQMLFIAFITVFGMFATAILLFCYWSVIRYQWLALLGVVWLLVFVIIRASSFHHVDTIISSTVFSLRLNWIFELGGIFMITRNAQLLIKRLRVGKPLN